MGLVKVVFESFGGREMERIFRHYFFFLLLLKQLILSIFSVPADSNTHDSVPSESEQLSNNILATDSSAESLNGVQVFQLMWTLALIETKGTTASKEL